MHGYVYLAHATPVDCELVEVRIWPIVGSPGSCGVSAVNIQTFLSNSKSVSEQACSKSLKHGNSILSSGGFFFSSRRRHTRSLCDWSSDVCSSDLPDQRNC